MLQGNDAWIARLQWIIRVFSIKELLRTLFSPWHRDRTQKNDGFNWGERLILNTFVRVIGFVFRVCIIVPGLLLALLIVLAWPAYHILPIRIDPEKLRRTQALGRDLAFGFTPELKRHARELGHRGETMLIGKDDAIEQIERVLAKPSHNNILLVGNSGSGRSVLMDQLAYRLARGMSQFSNLNYRHIWQIETESLDDQAFQDIVIESANAGNIILVIDNFHVYSNLPDLLLPYLEISSLQIVGITDPEGFHNRLKTRSDLLVAFEKVELQEPGIDEVSGLLMAIIGSYNCTVENDRVVAEIVRVTNQLEPYRSQPSKSIDLLMELITSSDNLITLADVYRVESQRSGVKIGEIDDEERSKLLNLENLLNQNIIGQAEAVSAISNALRRARSGVTKTGKPTGSFLFLGPTGVGKTHTAKTLADTFYGQSSPMFRIDMSEFNDAMATTRFIDRVSTLIEENPYTVALFDEIEKADRDVLNLFLQILDEGFITTTTGRKSYFSNAIVIATSNIGSNLLLENPNISVDELVEHSMSSGEFAPEFINRFDQVVGFKPFDENVSIQVAVLMMKELSKTMFDQKGISLQYSDDFILRLSQKGLESKFGAREVRRTIQDSVENYLARKILEDNVQPGSSIVIYADALDL